MSERKCIIALTGAAGAMGSEVLSHLLDSEKNYKIKILIHHTNHSRRFFKKLLKRGKDRIDLVYGSLADYKTVERLISGADYVIHCGAVIPPRADHNPSNTFAVNYGGTKNIIEAIKNSGRADSIKLVHISTVAVYGNRNHRHPWARVGDPVMSSAYDYYSAAKIKGERSVLESGLPNWAVLRQTAVYHKYFLANNMNDGLMFHTCWNAPLEWVTDSDSGRLIKNIVDCDIDGKADGFWRNAYNIGGGKSCRETGYETFNHGFGLMGASAEAFFEPHWNIPRNFHGVWFSDSHILEELFHFRRESSADFWKRMSKSLWYYKLGRIVPAALIKKFAIERLLKNSNAPMNWIRLNKKGRIYAFWDGIDAFNKIPRKWNDFPLLAKNRSPDGETDYEDLKDESKSTRFMLDHGYDESKPDAELDIEDMKNAAAFRGGSVVSQNMTKGALFEKLDWKCRNGHVFSANPFTILKAGFWCPVCCEALPWSFDKEAAHVPFYAQIWYDTHSKEEESHVYPYDEHEDDDLITGKD
ncbi:MAG: NAD-dependent epimerase/dehydratase family protein [Treponema sp.]